MRTASARVSRGIRENLPPPQIRQRPAGFLWDISGYIGISLITFLYVLETRWSSQMTVVDIPARR
jgi:hypothetical protein